ncbi:MAG TPA: BON domain-containing protein [Candidatus Limnocylindrales bacterium]|nr:BON domain-containing protein [Candidatus Limnocylindrales bacterium]
MKLFIPLTAAATVLLGTAWAQQIYTRTDVREAADRIERHGDEFKKSFKDSLKNVDMSDAEKRVRDSVDDLESATDHIKKDYKDGHYQDARSDLDRAMLLASPINRFMLRNSFSPEASRAWMNLKGDLNVMAVGFGVPPLPDLLPASLSSAPAAAARTVGSADRLYPGTLPQARIQREVRHELVLLPYYGVFDNLAYSVEGNTVILMGQVTRPTLKSDAEAVVKNIEGVDHVVNNIQVLPPSPADDRIRMATYRAVYGLPGLDRYALEAVPPIHIIVNNGRVTLDGVVSNQTDKNLAYTQALSVPGVFSVTNNLRVG